MKIFLDTANIQAITEWALTGIIDGATTNPTHLFKEGGDPKKKVLEICSLLPDGEISVEVTTKKPEDVYNQAIQIAALAKNILVKIPCHLDYYAVIKKLVEKKIKINVTLVFSLAQALMMCKLGVTYISPFVGRLDDIDEDGAQLLYEIRSMIDQYGFQTQLLAASLRSSLHFHEAIMAGADAATIPVKVLEQITQHELTDKGMKLFDADWQKLSIKQFP